MEKTVRLVTSKDADHAAASESVVRMLETWLQIAREGRLEGVALVALYADGSFDTSFSQTTSRSRLMGAIETMKLDFYLDNR